MTNWNFINGWSSKTTRVNYALVLGLIMTMSNQQTYADNEETPSIEFLEFLGSGVRVEDEFLDPVNYTEIELDAKDDRTEAKPQNDKMQKDDE